MNRRKVLKSITAAAGTAMILPNWANAWNPKIFKSSGVFSGYESEIISEITATFVPEGEIPGAKSLGVDKFLNRLFSDCYVEEDQQKIKNGILKLENSAEETYKMSFVKCTQDQKESLLMGFNNNEDENKKWFYNTLKNETIRGYTTSEYVMVNHYKYVVAPGFYHGCVNI